MADADPVPPKKTKGQQKIEVKAMDDAKKRSVTFTKRKAGLFRKADQLRNLTGAKVALMVISPGGKPYTFGNPDMDTVIARYKSHAPALVTLERQKAELREIMEQLAHEERRTQQLRNNRRHMTTETWMAAPTKTFSPLQQEMIRERMEQLNIMLSLGFNSFGFWWPPPDSTLPELQASSGLSCGSFMAPVTESQHFGGNMLLTPSGNFYTGESSSAAEPAGSQNLMFTDNMMLNTTESFYTGESLSMAPAGTQNQMSEGNIVLTPPGNFYTGEQLSMLPAVNQNHIFEDNMMVTPPGNFYTGESPYSMVPAETLNDHMFQNNMMLDNDGGFYTCGSSSMASESQSTLFDNNMVFAPNDNFFTSGFLSEEPTMNQMTDENIMIPPNDNFYTCGPSAVVPPPAYENQIFDENIMVPPNDNFYTSGSLAVVPPPPPPADENQIFDENIMVPPNDNFFTSGSLAVVPPPPLPADENQIFDESITHDNYNTFESSMVPATDDENLFSDQNLRLFLGDDQFYGSSSSMVPPAENQMFDGHVVAQPQPPPCDGYGAGPSGFN
ncbi:hypothetical protein K1719_000789 [Acacia pycnantha]|nr:hypothetical protein K1719_000789 [Acacia pycnantha]